MDILSIITFLPRTIFGFVLKFTTGPLISIGHQVPNITLEHKDDFKGYKPLESRVLPKYVVGLVVSLACLIGMWFLPIPVGAGAVFSAIFLSFFLIQMLVRVIFPKGIAVGKDKILRLFSTKRYSKLFKVPAVIIRNGEEVKDLDSIDGARDKVKVYALGSADNVSTCIARVLPTLEKDTYHVFVEQKGIADSRFVGNHWYLRIIGWLAICASPIALIYVSSLIVVPALLLLLPFSYAVFSIKGYAYNIRSVSKTLNKAGFSEENITFQGHSLGNLALMEFLNIENNDKGHVGSSHIIFDRAPKPDALLPMSSSRFKLPGMGLFLGGVLVLSTFSTYLTVPGVIILVAMVIYSAAQSAPFREKLLKIGYWITGNSVRIPAVNPGRTKILSANNDESIESRHQLTSKDFEQDVPVIKGEGGHIAPWDEKTRRFNPSTMAPEIRDMVTEYRKVIRKQHAG